MKIETRDLGVADLLKEFLFIPRFQRPFDWGIDQVEQFWTDTVAENPGNYFIGSFVLYREGDAFGVVDGQQRLTTIMLALCAVRNAFKVAGFTDLAAALQRTIERPDIDNKDRYVLTTRTSHPFLQDKILSDDGPKLETEAGSEEQRIVDAFEFLGTKVASAEKLPTIKGKGPARTKAALKFVRDRLLALRLISVQLDNEDHAYLIFETLNTRGKDLQVSHLLKNLLTRLISVKNKGLDPVNLKWASIQKTFDQSQVDVDIDEFLHHFWLSKKKYVGSKKLFVDIKRDIKTKVDAETLIDALVTDAKTYRSIVEPGFGKWRKDEAALFRSVEALAIFRVRQPFPLVLSVMRAYRAKKITKKNAATMLAAIERFHFAFTAVAQKSSSGGISKMYATWARELDGAAGEAALQKLTKKVKDELWKRAPQKSEFESMFGGLRYSDELTKQKKLIQYILRRLTEHFPAKGVSVDHSMMTIEHVAPQNPLPGATPVSPNHVAMLGNLLWCDNAMQDQLKNKSFPDKLAILKGSSVSGVEDLLTHTSWGEKEIEARTAVLADIMFEKIWK
jgi:uncharacterized protein with ParB-like and HNH nuclease domain